MGKLMQEFLEKDKALELAKEVEKVKEDMTKQLNVNAVTRLVAEQYKKAHYSTDQSKSYEHNKTFNDIIPLETDIDNGQLFDIKTGETTRDL
ncbi:MAG: hypothetical protein HUJ77_14960 [Clostridium sp.]|uniref:hypothetical protein n=1 Tax=Clostridium sp. TaxID=1506 RepID=UPI0025BFA4F7|nr:hypothetical protein [Clostridium sp.]MCF0149683.1 hypothetical protein [Clostridium sp.]